MVFYVTNFIKFLLTGVFFFYGSTDLSIILIFRLVSLCLLFSLMHCMIFSMPLRQYLTCCRIFYFPLFVFSFLLFPVWVIIIIWWSASSSQSFCVTRVIWFITGIRWVKNIISIAADNVLWFRLVAFFYKGVLWQFWMSRRNLLL